MDYLTWTYFFRRLMMNPSYYGLEDSSPDAVNLKLSELVRDGVCFPFLCGLTSPLFIRWRTRFGSWCRAAA